MKRMTFISAIFALSLGLAAIAMSADMDSHVVTVQVNTPGVTIVVEGDWLVTVDASDLQSGAGSDLNSTYTSPSDQVEIDIYWAFQNWRVSVRRDSNLHPDLGLDVRRMTNGWSLLGTISGGTNWIEIDTNWKEFFTGWLWRFDVRAQLRLTGMSINVPPGTYTDTVYYQVEDI
jgi:spore coat protein U-like protein